MKSRASLFSFLPCNYWFRIHVQRTVAIYSKYVFSTNVIILVLSLEKKKKILGIGPGTSSALCIIDHKSRRHKCSQLMLTTSRLASVFTAKFWTFYGVNSTVYKSLAEVMGKCSGFVSYTTVEN